MTPKEKAKELVDKFINADIGLDSEMARKCALISIEEITDQWEYIDTYLADLNGELNPNLKYWYNVRLELHGI